MSEETVERYEESAGFLKAVLASSPDIIGVLTKDGVFRYVNKVVEGLTMDQVVGSSVFNFSDEGEAESLKKYIAQALRENRTIWYETRALGPQKTEAYYSCSLSPFTYKEERLLVSIGTDITVRKKIEHELQDKISQLEVLNHTMVNREIKMVELKKRLEELGHPD